MTLQSSVSIVQNEDESEDDSEMELKILPPSRKQALDACSHVFYLPRGRLKVTAASFKQ